MKLTKKTKVLLALLAQLGPYPDRSEIIKRTKVQIKINRLLNAKDLMKELNRKEKFLYKVLKDYWQNDLEKRKQMINTVLISSLIKLIKDAYKLKRIYSYKNSYVN